MTGDTSPSGFAVYEGIRPRRHIHFVPELFTLQSLYPVNMVHTIHHAQSGATVPINKDCPDIIHMLDGAAVAGFQLAERIPTHFGELYPAADRVHLSDTLDLIPGWKFHFSAPPIEILMDTLWQ